MTLSELVVKLKAKGLTKQEALDKCKAKVKAAGKRWTVKTQSTFDEYWRKRLKPVVTQVPDKPKTPKVKDNDWSNVPPEPHEDDLEAIIGDIHLPRSVSQLTDYNKQQIRNWMKHRPKAEVQARKKALDVLLNLATRRNDKKLVKYAKALSDLFYEAKMLRKQNKG